MSCVNGTSVSSFEAPHESSASMTHAARVSLDLTNDLVTDQDQKPTWEELMVIKERENTRMLDEESSFNGSLSSGIVGDIDNNGRLHRMRTTSTEPMEWETISAKEAALLDLIARLQQQNMEQEQQLIIQSTMDNANQVSATGDCHGHFLRMI